jgi:hypothetical protein
LLDPRGVGTRYAWCSLPLLLALVSCAPAQNGLTVDVRTDLAPGTDFASVQIEVATRPFTSASAMGMVQPHALVGGEDFLRGERVAELPTLAPGDYYVRVSLLDLHGVSVLGRTTELSLVARYSLTVILASACRGVVCPEAGDPPTATECSGGHCVDPHCSPEASGSCGRAECRADVDCTSSASCGRAVCASGTCLVQQGVCEADAGSVVDAAHADDAATVPIDAFGEDAAPCGGNGQSCCAGGACSAGNVCSGFGVCGPCGNPSQPCCAGGACGGGQVCLSGTCMPCGGPFNACCAGGACGAGLFCNGFGLCACLDYANDCAGGQPCCGPYACGDTSAGTLCCGNDWAPCPDGDSSHCCGSLLCCNDGSNFVCVPPGTFPGC